MTCTEARAQLTAYLDGELEGERGSAVRGHLRACDACRQASTDEAALRDGLRALPPMDPPASLWAGVQARLAQAEVADAERPAWRRALARWWLARPQLGIAALALAAVALLIAWRVRHHDVALPQVASPVVPMPVPVPMPAPAPATSGSDVSDELAAAAAHETAGYAETATELVADAEHERAFWSDDHKQQFDAHVAELNKQIAAAADGKPRQKAYRTLIRYLQRAVTRDDVAFAGGVR